MMLPLMCKFATVAPSLSTPKRPKYNVSDALVIVDTVMESPSMAKLEPSYDPEKKLVRLFPIRLVHSPVSVMFDVCRKEHAQYGLFAASAVKCAEVEMRYGSAEVPVPPPKSPATKDPEQEAIDFMVGTGSKSGSHEPSTPPSGTVGVVGPAIVTVKLVVVRVSEVVYKEIAVTLIVKNAHAARNNTHGGLGF
jgi:hypothetical protein